jgi:hypothetical protein
MMMDSIASSNVQFLFFAFLPLRPTLILSYHCNADCIITMLYLIHNGLSKNDTKLTAYHSPCPPDCQSLPVR